MNILERSQLIRITFHFDITEEEKVQIFNDDRLIENPSFGDVVWDKLNNYIILGNKPSNICGLVDASTGTCINNIVIDFFHYDSVSELERSIKHIEEKIKSSIEEVRKMTPL